MLKLKTDFMPLIFIVLRFSILFNHTSQITRTDVGGKIIIEYLNIKVIPYITSSEIYFSEILYREAML